MNKNGIRQINSIKSSNNTCSNTSNVIGAKNISYQKESNISLNKNNNEFKNISVSSNQILHTIRDEIKSKSSVNIKIKKKDKEKINLNKKKKKKDKMANLLKNNEKLKIPTGKRRRSIAVNSNNIKLNLNNLNNILKSLTPPKEINRRTDKNGIEINKDNKKKVHITFLDDISPNNKITETVNIQSFKKFNLVEKNQSEQKISNCSNCCNIF